MIDDGRRQTILLVDDETDILVALEDLFEADYRVLSSSSPERALAMLAAEPDVAVIVSDQRMPGMTGNVFLSRAREIVRAEALLLTGYADLEAVISAVNDGRIVGYAHKPWEPEALKAMVATAAMRHQLRRALAFERAVFTGLAQQTDRAIAVLGPDGSVLRANGVLDADHAATPEDLDALRSGVAEETEGERGGDDRSCWIRTQRIPFEVEGQGRHLLRIESDETRKRLTEQKLLHSEKLQALGTLAGGIAHDFNNLLAAVLGNLELAERLADAGGKMARYVGNAAHAARRGTAITRRLLSFTRQRDLTATLIDANLLVRDMEELIVRSMSGIVSLVYDLDDAAGQVRVDADQLELALLNLCINARDAMPGGGDIRLSTRGRHFGADNPLSLAAGDYVGIAVTDHGSGMTPEVRARVFEPFFTTKEPGKGTGLGLPMVHAMAEAAGGVAAIDSVPGEGTTVTVWLPRAEGVAALTVPAAITPAQRPLAIVLAEDDPQVRAVAADYLAELGHDVTLVATGGEALAAIGAGTGCDLLITDYAMPGMSGVEVAQGAMRLRPGLPVLMMTGFAEVTTLPANISVIAKPFTCDALARAIADLSIA